MFETNSNSVDQKHYSATTNIVGDTTFNKKIEKKD